MSEPRTDPLTPGQIEKLAVTLGYWAERHPAPMVPVLGFAFGGLALSPLDIARAVQAHARGDGDETSASILRMFQFATEVKSFEAILSELRDTAGGTEPPREMLR